MIKVSKKVKMMFAVTVSLLITSVSAFGMYGDRDSWIDFLVHGNQFRARMDQLGFVLGNGTIKGTFGFRSQAVPTTIGSILSGETGKVDLDTTISAGIGYTSDIIGVGLGYNYTYQNARLGVHTPVLMINALNNNLRIAVPVQIAVSKNPFNKVDDSGIPINTETDYMGISTDVQIRYYTGIDAFNQIRVYFRYGQAGYKNKITDDNIENYFAQSVGFQARFYFLNTTVGNVGINPFVRVDFNTALVEENKTVRAGDAIKYNEGNPFVLNNKKEWDKNPYDVKAEFVLGMSASSDIVNFYLEPSLGYKASYKGKEKSSGGAPATDSKISHTLSWGAYTELYIRPVQDLEWYFEMDVNNSTTTGQPPVKFNATTGITWYLPSLNGAQ